MDWAKAKVVLIVAFLVTNIFLGYNLSQNSSTNVQKSFLSSEYKGYVNDMLQKKNIKLNARIPSGKPSRLGPVTIKYDSVDTETFQDLIADKNADIEIVNGKKLIMTLNEEDFEYSRQSAIDYSLDFIEKYGLDGNGILLKGVKEQEDFIEVEYSSAYKKYFLENSHMNFCFYKSKDIRIERLWMSVIDDNFQRKMTITPLEALVKIYPEIDEGSIIEDIRLGYYFKIGEDIKIKDTKTAKAFPVWRITLSDGTEKYASALDL